jgi:hypothetical protein
MSQNFSLPRNDMLDNEFREAEACHEAASPTPWMILLNARAAYAIAHQCKQP